MLRKMSVYLLLSQLLISATALDGPGFIYNGFQNANLSRDGVAEITANGLLRLTNDTKQQTAHAFYAQPLKFKTTPNGTSFSFSTTFVFAIAAESQVLGGHGIVFVIAPSNSLPGALPSQYLGLFNATSNGNSANHVVAVELDTIYNSDFSDINDNHVGININSLHSHRSAPVVYSADGTPGGYNNLTLINGERMQVWVDYDGVNKNLSVAIAPFRAPKPKVPLLYSQSDISSILLDSMYVGFSSATGSFATSHYILGWSFQMNGQAEALDLSRLPTLPRGSKQPSKFLTIVLPVVLPVLVLTLVFGTYYLIRRKRKYAEVFDEWELNYGAHRIKYKDLYIATKGFKDTELLGIGGFGRVYKGILPNSHTEVAVKKVSHESRQGIREFIAEIVSIGQLRQRNIVQLLGYCRRKDELLLVYDYMPNGGLDKFLFGPLGSELSWSRRFGIIKDVATGLVYLHEQWEQVVIHRDIKASNVLVDGEFNGRLGDFGLARLYDHGKDPQTTHVVGTIGYLAPELSRTGRATTSTDVFAFGVFLLEVVCGRRPVELLSPDEYLILVEWVISAWSRGDILETCDPNLGNDCVEEEVELSLKLGLLCSQPNPTDRPSMRRVLQFLNKDVPLPDLSTVSLSSQSFMIRNAEGFDDFALSYSQASSSESLLSAGH